MLRVRDLEMEGGRREGGRRVRGRVAPGSSARQNQLCWWDGGTVEGGTVSRTQTLTNTATRC